MLTVLKNSTSTYSDDSDDSDDSDNVDDSDVVNCPPEAGNLRPTTNNQLYLKM